MTACVRCLLHSQLPPPTFYCKILLENKENEYSSCRFCSPNFILDEFEKLQSVSYNTSEVIADRQHQITHEPTTLSSSGPISRPLAPAMRTPCTILPTNIAAGPTSDCCSRGFGRLITQLCGHISNVAGCRFPSRKRCRVSDTWIPPRGVCNEFTYKLHSSKRNKNSTDCQNDFKIIFLSINGNNFATSALSN